MRSFGDRGEDIAAKHLKDNGYAILERNYKTPFGEVDIIAKEKDTIVFIEVKARSSDVFGQPFESVNYRKQERIKKIALYYFKHNKIDCEVRFDVISIISSNGRHELNHIKEAFQ